jgi:predicted extracellular nuclease
MSGEAIAGIITAGGGVLVGVMEAYRRIAAGNTKRITNAIGQQTAAINQQTGTINGLVAKNGRDQTYLQEAVRSLKDVAITMLRTSERCETVESIRRGRAD